MAESRAEWFDQLYKTHMADMMLVAKAALKSLEAAEDVVQDVFILLLAKEEQVRTYKRPQGWLYLTLRNQIGNYLQREKYRHTLPLDTQENFLVEDTRPGPLSESLPAGLTQEEREILLLFYENRLSCEEISQQIHRSVSACRTRLCRARARCKELYLAEEK